MTKTAEKTDPKLWEKVKLGVTKSDKGGKPGQWSARKAQIATQEYKKEGGGYKGPKSSDNRLTQWAEEEWGTKSGAESGKTGERYLPRKAREHLSEAEYKRTTANKRADTANGKQYSAQPKDVATKTARYRETGHRPTRADLLKQAANKRIAGRSKMTKAALEKAVTSTAEPGADRRRNIAQEFKSVVNMTPAALRSWLKTPESRSVGTTHEGAKVTQPGGQDAVGHEMGHHILSLYAKKADGLNDDDYAAMRKVVGYVHRHMKQRPDGDVTETRWRKSLMNWGHDPLK